MNAASMLVGLTLPNGGWKVTRALPRHPTGTGGTFSHSYCVEKDGVVAFLKAFDFSEAFEPGADTADILQPLIAAYNFERSLLEHCRNRRLSNVVLSIDHGQIQVPNIPGADGTVLYLIFEMADGDVRRQMSRDDRFDMMASMRALRDVALGLAQIHREMIAHQDTKPSNILVFPSGFKISDFGRSSRRGQSVWYDDHPIAGDRQYAPPELIYGYTHPEFIPRRMGCDLFMFGNLAAFLFSGVNLSAALQAKLDPQHHPAVWNAGYLDILPYLQAAFTRVLEDLAPLIDEIVREQVLSLVKELCNPDLSKRGHPRGLGKHDQFSMERYVTDLDLAVRKLDLALRTRMRSA